jgi:hypothetical protein
MKTRFFALLIATGFAVSPNMGSAQDAAPGLIPVQGRLTDTAGNPLEGAFDITFSIYDSEDANATPLLTELQSVEVRKGFFTAYIGDTSGGALNLLPFKEHQVLFVGIKVRDNPEATPRLQLGTAPFAAFSQFARDTLTIAGIPANELQRPLKTTCAALGSYIKEIAQNGSVVCGSELGGGTVSTAQIVDGTITSADLAEKSVNDAKLAINAVNTVAIADGTITSSDIAAGAIVGNRIAANQISMACNVVSFTNTVATAASQNIVAVCPLNTFATGGGCSATSSGSGTGAVVFWQSFKPIFVDSTNSAFLCQGLNTSTGAVSVTSHAQCCRVQY